ncbi:hypothetical protein [Porphyromonas levii]|uniref:hypothetical protein n=1 Tax=Porphyromonas levii TaxID=28114 RepID=UPI001BA66CA6|nr:hypothetical protein [Porphyromonas levii]MBR8802005.1 hypothetical protein [Porphyromonas levii]
MVERPSLVSLYLPQLGEWWAALLASPWLTVVFVVLALLAVRRHGELAYGTYHVRPLGLLLLLVYLVGVPLTGIFATNLGFIAMILVVILSDSVVMSISRSRSTFFVYDLGVALALLFLIHPIFVVLLPFFLGKLRTIHSSSLRHIIAYVAGYLTILALATMLFATRSWAGILQYWSGWIAPLGALHWPKLLDIPLLVLDTAYLVVVSVAVSQMIRASTVRVRVAMGYHIQLAWVLMLMNLLYGVQGEGNYGFLLSSLFLSGAIADYLLTQRRTRWLLLPLLVVLSAAVGVRVWLYLGQPTL